MDESLEGASRSNTGSFSKNLMATVGVLFTITVVSLNVYAVYCVSLGRNVVLQSPFNIVLSLEEEAARERQIVEEAKYKRK